MKTKSLVFFCLWLVVGLHAQSIIYPKLVIPSQQAGIPAGLPPTGAAGGVLGGTYPNPSSLEGVTPTGATGTGNLVFSASPTLTGTVTASTITAAADLTLNAGGANQNVALVATGSGSVNVTHNTTGQYIFNVNNANTTAGNSYGAQINGGTTLADRALTVANAANNLVLFSVSGNGAIAAGGSTGNIDFSTSNGTFKASSGATTLPNLTSNGIVTTSGGGGLLSITATTGTGSVVLSTAPVITGHTDGSSAASTSIGYTSTSTVSSASEVSLTTATAADITTITVGAGTWLVWGHASYDAGAGTIISLGLCSIGTSANTIDPYTNGKSARDQFSGVAGGSFDVKQDALVFTSASSQTFHLVAQASFSVSTCAAFGSITALRIY